MDEAPKYQIYLSTSPDVQRSTQAVLMEKADTSLECIYTGEGTITDEFMLPAIMKNKVQRGNVFMMGHPDDVDGGMYEGIFPKEEPQ